LRKELRKIAVDDGGLSVDETGVEVALEHGQNALDLRVGRRLGEKRLQGLRQQGAAQGEDGGADKVSALHVYLWMPIHSSCVDFTVKIFTAKVAKENRKGRKGMTPVAFRELALE
jgi:hypothetical protein